MKRSRFGRRGGLTRDAEQLVRLAGGLAQSGSRIEDRFWERRLAEVVDRLLAAGNDDAINAALDDLYRGNGTAYGELADLVEAHAEGGLVQRGAETYECLLLALPLLAWSRYSIPAGNIPPATLQNLRVQLHAHVLATDTRLGLADILFSPDQLPQSYGETRGLTDKLSVAALGNADLPIDSRRLPETAAFLSDMRYVLAVAAAPAGSPLLRWQETDGSLEQSLARWREQGAAAMQPLLAGCSFEVVAPNAFHYACREADRQLRPYSLRASVAFLQMTLDTSATELRAVLAPFAERRLEEFRIGFTRRTSNEVLHGVVWPLLDAEDETTDTPGQIESVLRETGITEIVAIDHQMPLEYCDDCGAPLYPDGEGQAVHAEMPEQPEDRPAHLH